MSSKINIRLWRLYQEICCKWLQRKSEMAERWDREIYVFKHFSWFTDFIKEIVHLKHHVVRVSGSAEIPNWFEKMLFTVSTGRSRVHANAFSSELRWRFLLKSTEWITSLWINLRFGDFCRRGSHQSSYMVLKEVLSFFCRSRDVVETSPGSPSAQRRRR